MYSPQVIDHYKNPRNVGMIKDADGVGIVGTPASGEMIEFWIRVYRDRIVSARFKAFGCPTVIAAGSVATQLVQDTTIEEALKITNRQIDDVLGGLPPDKQRYAIDAQKVVQSAINDYTSKVTNRTEEKDHDIGH